MEMNNQSMLQDQILHVIPTILFWLNVIFLQHKNYKKVMMT